MMRNERLRLNLVFGEKRRGGEARHKRGSLEVRKGGEVLIFGKEEGHYKTKKKEEKKMFLRGRRKKKGRKESSKLKSSLS